LEHLQNGVSLVILELVAAGYLSAKNWQTQETLRIKKHEKG